MAGNKVKFELYDHTKTQIVEDTLYKRFANAETKGFEDNPFIRTVAKNTQGGSTAFGPVQITLGLLRGVKSNMNKYNFTPDEKRALEVFLEQGKLFSKHGNEKGKEWYDPDFDYGGMGFFSKTNKVYNKEQKETLKIRYKSITSKVMSEMKSRLKDADKVITEWRFGPSHTVEQAKKKDSKYFDRYYEKK